MTAGNGFAQGTNAATGDFWPYPYWQWQAPAYVPPPCDHCLCGDVTEDDLYPRTVPHKRCCHCLKLYATELIQGGRR